MRNCICVVSILLSLPAAVTVAQPATRPSSTPSSTEFGPLHPSQVEIRHQMERLQAMHAEIEQQVRLRRDELQALTGRIGATPLNVRAAIDTLEADQLKLEVDKVGLTARRDALADAVARLSVQAEKRVQAANQDLIQSLKLNVQMKEAELKRTQELFNSGAAAAAEVSRVQGELESAKISLNRELNTPPKNVPELETLASLNRSLIDTSVSLTETAARLDYVTQRLKPLASTQEKVDQLEQLERARLQVEQELMTVQRAR